MSDKNTTLPWIPGLRRPNYVLPRLSFSIPKRIPPVFIYLFVYLSIFYIFSGGVYNAVENPPARRFTDDGPILVYRGIERQYLIEGFVAGLVIFMGFIGLYLLSEATKDPHNPDRTMIYQTVGVILMILAFIILQSMYELKLPPDQ